MATSSNPLPPVPPVPPSHFYQQQQQQQQQAQVYYQQPQQAPGQDPYQQQNWQQPPPPQQPQHSSQGSGSDGHPRAGQRNRTFSFQSNKSHKSTELVETSAEKEAKRLHSKADPTLAMSEAEPGVVAATVKSSLAPLRNMRHKDMHGNMIDDPDRSNPTRSRWERPLDTIRSFEAAIDGGYNNRQSMIIRSDSDSVMNWDRRSSYFAPSNAGGMSMLQGAGASPRPRSMVHGHSQHRLTRPPMPGNAYNGRYQRDSYYSTRGGPPDRRYGGWTENQGDPYGSQGYNAYSNVPRTRYPRMASEPQFPAQRQPEHNNVYPMPINHRSYETVASGSGSGSSGEHAGYQTDPTSSDNSSIERVQSPPKRQDPVNDYGIGFSQNSNYQAPSFTVAVNGGPATPQAGGNNIPSNQPPPPVVPTKQNTILRKPTRAPSTASTATAKPGMGEKRKSWFARRFSKNS
ncbi:hypothetical protein RB595_008501 [Gaeumannomyces hyphopodioides]